MIRRYESGHRLALMVADGVLAVLVVSAVFAARFGTDWEAVVAQSVPEPRLWILLFAVVWVAILTLNGAYLWRARWTLAADAAVVGRSTLVMAGVTVAAVFFAGPISISRLALLALFPIQGLATILARIVLRYIFKEASRRGRNLRYVLIVGTDRPALAFAAKLEQHWELGLKVTGFVGVEPPAGMGRYRYLGPVDRLPDLLHENVIDEVAIWLPATDPGLIDGIYRLAADEGKTIRMPIVVPEDLLTSGHVEELEGSLVLSIAPGQDHALGLAAKRLVDIAGATIGLILLSPVFALVAMIIAATDGRPVLFFQERAGVNGRPFRMVKFRTMVRDADAQRAALRTLNEIEGGASFKLTDDPRITPIGRVLRKTSVDELPQLWNVLRGEMSLVGPRPHPYDDVAGYDPWHRRRLTMKPGITGLWQIAGRREKSFDRWVQLDLEYIDRWSMWLDVRLIVQTIPAMIRAEGR
jgi:exopolysaccharide biosynthesis polyprenyl glycosylphosphotransferase